MVSRTFAVPLRRRIALLLAVIAISSVVFFRNVFTTPFHGDESGWISSGRYYSDLLLSGNFRTDAWEGSVCGPWNSLNQNLGKWMYGLPLKLYALQTGRQFWGFYNGKLSLEENRKRGNVPPDDILFRARMATAAGGVLICVLLFLIGARVRDDWTGLLAAGLAIANPLFVVSCTRAMPDAFYCAFLLGGCLTAIYLTQSKRPLKWSVACGLFAGLAFSIKVTGVVIGLSVFAVCLIYLLCLGALTKGQAAKNLGLGCLSALVAIYLLNPYFWPTVPNAPRLRGYQQRAAWWENPEWAPGIAPGMLRAPEMFVRWQTMMARQGAPETWRWQGNRELTLNRTLFGDLATFPLETLFLAGGLVWAIRRLVLSIKKRTPDPSFPILATFLINYLFILALMEMNYDRYYLPTVLAGRVLIGVALVQLYQWSYAQVKRRGAVKAYWQGGFRHRVH